MYPGDGGPATSARLSNASGIAIDADGNIYIADSGFGRIRRVAPTGVITTVAGGGGTYPGDGGPATSARLSNAIGIAIDAAGNIYIADKGDQRVRKVTPAGEITTVAGSGREGFSGDGGPATSASLDGPSGVALDAVGNLYVADKGNDRIRRVTPAGTISTVAGNERPGYGGDGGPATSAFLLGPSGVAIDAAGDLYIGDTYNHVIRRVTTAGVISTAAGTGIGDGGPVTSAQVHNPRDVAVGAAGDLYIADAENHRVRKVTPAGVISTVAGGGKDPRGNGGPATSADLCPPDGIAVDARGNLYIADCSRVLKVTPAGIITTVAGGGNNPGGDGGPATAASLGPINNIALDMMGNLYFSEWPYFVRRVTPAGVISTVGGMPAWLNWPMGVACDTAGNLYIAEFLGDRIRKVTPAGQISTVAGTGTPGFSGDGGPAISAQITRPQGIAVDTTGNLYIAEGGRIRRVTPAGVISTVAGGGSMYPGDGGPATSASLDGPSGVALDAVGNLYIAEAKGNRIRKVAVGPRVSSYLTLEAAAASTSRTAGSGGVTQAGYASVFVNAGTTPYGTAVFSFEQNGVIVSEAGVPASAPTTRARIFIEYRSAAPAVPGRIDAGRIDVNTGIAVVNYGSATANVTYVLRDTFGTQIPLGVGHGTIAAGAHFAKFIHQLQDVARGFRLPLDFQSVTQFGSLEISSDQPLSILALRQTLNQRNETLFTTTPIADLRQAPSNSPIYFPQFVDGGGYATALVLLNTSMQVETGTLRTLDDKGGPLAVSQVGGTAGSSFKYSIPPGGAYHFQTDGSPVPVQAGWVQLMPDVGTSTPVGAGVFSYNPGNVLVTESGIPVSRSTTHARIYVDLSGDHDTGLAMANLVGTNAHIVVNAFQSDGTTPAGTGQDSLELAGMGHSAMFASELIKGLPSGFVGVLDISSATPFAALTVRSLTNGRNEFLLTTFPIADLNEAAPWPIIFPQIADGGGYATEFILIGAGGPSNLTLNFHGENGASLAVGQ